MLKIFSDLYPEAPIFTLLYDKKKCGQMFDEKRIRPSILQSLPSFLRKRPKYLLPLIPRVIEMFDFTGYDLVLSSSNSFSHGILMPLGTKHVCYCHSPMRFAWDWSHEYIEEQGVGSLRRLSIAWMMKHVRMWEQIVADRADFYIANSKTVQKRIQKYYRMPSQIIYPGVDVARFRPQKHHENFFLLISTLTPYKKIDLAIRLFNKTGKHLIIVGEGNQRSALERMAGKNIEFTGFKPDHVVTEYLENCRALIFPGEEDFGIVPVEAMACGKPILALGRGGVTETVLPGITGEFFHESTIDSMEDGLARLLLHEKNYDADSISKHAQRFSIPRFEKEIQASIETFCASYSSHTAFAIKGNL